MSASIKEYIISLLLKKASFPEGIDLDQYRFLDEGHIDSMGLTQFIFEIENEYDFQFSPEESQSDEFRYIGGIVGLISKKLNK